MPPLSLGPLTRREQAVADFFRRSRVADVCMVATAVMLGLLAWGVGRAYCNPPADPISSSAGVSYCARMAHRYSWVAYTVAAGTLALTVRGVWRGRYARRIAIVTVSVAVIASTVWVYSLPTGVG
jgi:hypothetical protein